MSENTLRWRGSAAGLVSLAFDRDLAPESRETGAELLRDWLGERGRDSDPFVQQEAADAVAVLEEAISIPPGDPRWLFDGSHLLHALAARVKVIEFLISAREAAKTAVHARRGRKVLTSAQAGHEAVHGTAAEKERRWRSQADAYDRARAAGLGHAEAVAQAAAECACGVKTVRRTIASGRGRPVAKKTSP